MRRQQLKVNVLQQHFDLTYFGQSHSFGEDFNQKTKIFFDYMFTLTKKQKTSKKKHVFIFMTQ